MMETILKPYPEYHRIDLPWQQHIPAHWTRLRLKHLLREVDERTQTGEEPLMSLTRSRGLVRRSEITDKPPSAKTLIGYKVCRPGDIVMNRMQAWSGMFGLASEVGLVSPDYAVLRLIGEADGGFLLSLLKAPGPVSHFAALSTGMGSGFNRLYTDQLGAVPIATPPHEEQVQVARVIRDIDRRVNRLIRAKQRLIALLNEQKQAIIQRAVTRGLDPDVPLKPSGVDWLGDVPEHWEVTKLTRIVRSSNAGEVIDKGWWGSGSETLYTCSREPMKSDYRSFPSGKRSTGNDLLLTRNGTPYIHRPDRGSIYSNVVQRIKLLPGMNREWIARSLEVATRSMRGYGVSIESLNYGMWKNLVVILPPASEQRQLVDSMDQSTSAVGEAISTAEREIALLREYRTRLIADVVTGKLDVRGVAVPEVEGDGAAVGLDMAEDDEPILDEEALAPEEA